MKNSILDNKVVMTWLIISCLALGWCLQIILFQNPGQAITIMYLEDKDMIKYKSNLNSIADEKCNENYQQYSYSSKDYSANIRCRDKTEFDLDFKTVMSYVENKKK